MSKRIKAMSKYELADLAGVSRRTFGRWLKCHEAELSVYGVRRKTQLLPPGAVKHLCNILCIDLPE